MLRYVLIILFLVPSLLFAQQTKKEKKRDKIEKEKVVQKNDSLEQKLNETNKLAETSPGVVREQQMVDKYGKNKGKLIAAGKVWTSISFEMALDSWGEPTNKQKSELSNMTTERWIYPDNRFLYFENGRLISWRE